MLRTWTWQYLQRIYSQSFCVIIKPRTRSQVFNVSLVFGKKGLSEFKLRFTYVILQSTSFISLFKYWTKKSWETQRQRSVVLHYSYKPVVKMKIGRIMEKSEVCFFFRFVWTTSYIVHWKLLTWNIILDIQHEFSTAEEIAFKVFLLFAFSVVGLKLFWRISVSNTLLFSWHTSFF